jgi:DNA-binding GntR family transcriptional regulator
MLFPCFQHCHEGVHNTDRGKEIMSGGGKIPRGDYLYSDVARQLRKRIGEQVYMPGSKLPSMSELCASFGVSAITVRNALRELTQEGLISGHQGLGVFVKEKGQIHRVLAGSPQRSIGDEITRAGFRARLEEISCTEFKADTELAQYLHIRRGARVFRHEKLTYADDEPVALHIVTLAADLARKLRPELGRTFLFRLLAEHGVAVANLRCEFSALLLSEEHSRWLKLPAGFPMLRVRYTPLDRTGSPILSGVTIARSDRFLFEVDLPQKSDG